MNAGPATIDSKVVDRSLRAILWPSLKAEGFDRRTGRTTWRDRPGCVQTVNVQSFNSYLAEAIGSTTFSFSVNLGVFYAVIAERSALGPFVKDPSRPAEYHCHARYHLAKGISQPHEPSTKRSFDARAPTPTPGAWEDRPDVWYVRRDGSNVDEAVADARDRVVTIGLPWLERLSDPSEARRAIREDPETHHARGIVAEGYGGAIGSPARWHAFGALSIALGDPDGIAWATREMESQPYYREHPANLEALRRASGQGQTAAAGRLAGMTTIRPALEASARAGIARRTEELFRSSGALRDGHFQLKSGRHGDAYVEKFAVLSDPAATSELCGFWAAALRGDEDGAGDPSSRVDLVAGPTTGGVILAFETGRQLGVRAIFAEEVRDADGATRREFRRGFRIEPGERVLLVDDILTTGGSLLAMLPAVEAMGGEIIECAVLVDRSGGGTATLTSPATGRTYPLRSLWQLDLPTYEPGPATCRGCAKNIPLHVPGSSGTGA